MKKISFSCLVSHFLKLAQLFNIIVVIATMDPI